MEMCLVLPDGVGTEACGTWWLSFACIEESLCHYQYEQSGICEVMSITPASQVQMKTVSSHLQAL